MKTRSGWQSAGFVFSMTHTLLSLLLLKCYYYVLFVQEWPIQGGVNLLPSIGNRELLVTGYVYCTVC